MKTKAILLILGLFIAVHVSAQTHLKPKADSLFVDPYSLKRLLPQKEFKLKIPQAKEYSVPQNKYFLKRKPGESLALKNDSNALFHAIPNYRMPVYRPKYQSKMPVMKPDSTIHYHLQIKKF
jgi:hypothetical protein